jgi:hypothetical protein
MSNLLDSPPRDFVVPSADERTWAGVFFSNTTVRVLSPAEFIEVEVSMVSPLSNASNVWLDAFYEVVYSLMRAPASEYANASKF